VTRLLWLLPLLLVGCASYIDYGNGRYGVVKDAQQPVAVGVSNSFAVLQNCEGRQRDGYHYEKLDFTDCHDTTEPKHASAPGWFPHLFNGLANLAGFGWVASTQGGASSSASAVQSQSVTVTGGKGH
jgi:hypothetical protein